MPNGYTAFLDGKHDVAEFDGIDVNRSRINSTLFDFQTDLVQWSLRKGRSAIFADTGLGKTFMQIEWARLTDQPTLIIAPLAVVHQTVEEAARLNVDIAYAKTQDDVTTRITITNYERLEAFKPAEFGAVVLDESSILKNYTGKTRTSLIEAFSDTPYRLCCTATPALNDIAEIANHAEFLGLMSRVEMLAAFFVHDDNGWRLKGHAHDAFYKWLASWSMAVKRPSEASLDHTRRTEMVYVEEDTTGDGWELKLGDSCVRLAEIDTDSIGLSVFSPPFESLYTYSPSDRDLGNSASTGEFWNHFSFISEQLLRILMPGRLAAIHVQQIATTKTVEGHIGLRDFRGATIKHFEDQGFIYHGEVCIDKDPQAQAIRTKAKSLMFVQLKKDSPWMRTAFADYIILMRKPGDNPEPIDTDVTNDEWIQFARPIWYGIRESDTLNVRTARSEKDERHIAPLQLGTIERCIRLWSNKGDTVMSPFAGIGSEGYVAIQHGRQFVGIELKPEYFNVAVTNMQEAERKRDEGTLFDGLDDETA